MTNNISMRLFIFLFCCTISWAQQTSKVDFITVQVFMGLNPDIKQVVGTVIYDFEVLKPIDTIRIDAKNMQIDRVKINEIPVAFRNNTKQLLLFDGYKKGANRVSFSYKCNPKQALYFNGTDDNLQIWTQGQGKYTSNWLPSFDDVNEKVIFNISFNCPKEYVAISNGVLKNVQKSPNGDKMWNYKMQKPMSSYLVMLAVGDYRNKVIGSKSGVPLQRFIFPKDTAKFESTYKYSKEIFDYLEEEIDFNYPWQVYKQVPVEDFLYAGMENTSATIFDEDFVVDEVGFNDRNYVNVQAHELAHQWFGDVVTAKSGKHHWLQEGFATYYALLAEKKVFGEDYFYHQMYRNSLQLKKAAKTDTIPILSEKASSLSYYQKGAWALHFLRETIGAKAFQKAVKNYLNKYQFKNVETDDFLVEIHKVAPAFDTEGFKKTWLMDYHFPSETVNELLKKNAFIQQLFDIQQKKTKPLAEHLEEYKKCMASKAYYPVKTEILFQLKELPFADKKDILLLALQTNDIKVRQAVAEFLEEIPMEFKADYESLLDDASYETQEIAFMNLWKNFPNSRATYLAKAKNWTGGNDKSLRILYLTFSILSIEGETPEKTNLYNELLRYTTSNYSTSVRQNALSSLLSINNKDKAVLKNLVQATTHYKWQFSKFAKDKIRELLTQEEFKPLFTALIPSLNEQETTQLNKLLK